MYRHQYVDEKTVNEGIKKVIFKLIIGLFISFLAMFVVYNVESLTLFIDNYTKELLALTFIFPVFFTLTINRFNIKFMNFMLLMYSILAGLPLVYTIFKYGSTLIVLSIGATTIIFTLMAMFAYHTNEDLERERVLLKISLFFLIITYLVNMYFGVYILHWILAYWALINFTGLVGYDFQHVKKELSEAVVQNDSFERISLTGTLQFYLNFIILSLVLLNIFGKILI